MLYCCEHCDYKTDRLLNYKRHTTRKTPCKNINERIHPNIRNNTNTVKVNAVTVKVNAVTVKVNADPVKVNADPEKVNAVPEKVNDIITCNKCTRVFTRKDHMKVHEQKCDGIDKRQCQICLKLFTTKQGKYQHIQYVKCNPPPSAPQMVNNGIINHGTINNNTINIITQGRLSFGKENLEELFKEPKYVERLLSHITEGGKYALVRSMDDIFFNEKYPNNQTIKKTRKNDNFVEVYKNGEWVKMFMKDIFTPINHKIEDYYDPFFERILSKNMSLHNPRYKQLMYFAKQMKQQGWNCDTIEDYYTIIEDSSDNAQEKRTKKETMRLMLDNTYAKSKNNTVTS
jgi:hypothetical protein